MSKAKVKSRLAPGQTNVRAAGVEVRVVARAIDCLLVLVIAVVGSLIPGSSESGAATAVSCALVAVAVSIGEASMLHRWGRTPGKAMFGLSVLTLRDRRVPFLRGLARATLIWVPPILGGFVFGAAGPVILVGALTAVAGPALFRRDHRGLHDLATATWVVAAGPSH